MSSLCWALERAPSCENSSVECVPTHEQNAMSASVGFVGRTDVFCMHVFAYLTCCNQTELNTRRQIMGHLIHKMMWLRAVVCVCVRVCVLGCVCASCDCCKWVAGGSLCCGKHLRRCSFIFFDLMSNYNNHCRHARAHTRRNRTHISCGSN